jgi:hypothetical protein
MPVWHTVRIVISEHPAVIFRTHRLIDEGQIEADNLIFLIGPDFDAEQAFAERTADNGCLIGSLLQSAEFYVLPGHSMSLAQV